MDHSYDVAPPDRVKTLTRTSTISSTASSPDRHSAPPHQPPPRRRLVGKRHPIAEPMQWIGRLTTIAAVVAVVSAVSKKYSWDKDSALQVLEEMSQRLGPWAIPAYVAAHTVTLALCLPYAVFFEAGVSLLFGFLPAIACVFSAKILGASLSFWIGRVVFRSSSSAMEWAQRSKYFHLLSRGVERDGWRFVLLARFSPLPSYVINYALAATKVRFLVDFLFPTVIGSLPMILQNISIGSLANAAVASTTGSRKSQVLSYLFPLMGITSSILITLRIKKYSSEISTAGELNSHKPTSKEISSKYDSTDGPSESVDDKKVKEGLTKRH